MAKKKPQTTKSSATAKAPRKSAGSTTKKPPQRSHSHNHHHDEDCCDAEIELDDTERKTIDMVLDSDTMREALETEVDAAVSATVRKVCRHYGAPLSAAQAQNVAMVLFGD
jgi:hypothetical protein